MRGKARVVAKAVRAVVVAVVKVLRPILTGLLLGVCSTVYSTVLPEDRSDVLTHSYQGGGMDITGPSILVRKGDDKSFSAYAHYYVDNISSASVDVLALGASRYQEKRVEKSVGFDYLHGKSIMSFGYTNSDENDYVSDTYNFGISMDMFGDLTTVSLGYSQGKDDVYKTLYVDGVKTRDPDFHENVVKRQYSIGLTQVVSKNLLIGLNFDTITDEGYLHNPYRQYRYVFGDAARYGVEVYPGTRTSKTGSIKFKYYLPYRAAIQYQERLFNDDWGIVANDSEVGYTHPIGENLIIEVRYRLYSQTKADFYSDLHAEASTNPLDFRARDKEMSNYNSKTMGLVVSYEFAKGGGWWFIDKASLNLAYDYMQFHYNDFRDARVSKADASLVGKEPLYQFSANVLQLFLSVWY